MRIQTSLCLLFLMLLTASLPAAEKKKPDPSENAHVKQAIRLFAEWAEGTMALDRIPGASLGLVSDQKLIWSKGYGHADLQLRTPATPETLYGICSISKLFTAISVLQQRDAGKLR